ncbi:dynein axonemal assembly factor 10-like [Myotis yumanensis]|uniref:dynein axonemal assembly factor 10-like n=1 Tax=Myotis yumanensis TaxID=159337 RepID=UPI0038D06021
MFGVKACSSRLRVASESRDVFLTSWSPSRPSDKRRCCPGVRGCSGHTWQTRGRARSWHARLWRPSREAQPTGGIGLGCFCRRDKSVSRHRPKALGGNIALFEKLGLDVTTLFADPTVYRLDQIIAYIQKGLNYTVFDCKWMPCSAKFVTMGNFAQGPGVIQLYEIRHGDLKLLREIEKAKPIKCGTFGATSLQQRYLATGDFAGNLYLGNMEAPEYPVYSVKDHKEIINTIDGVGGLGVGEGAPDIVTGSRDGTVKGWDPGQEDDPVANMEPVQRGNKRGCRAVAFAKTLFSGQRKIPKEQRWELWVLSAFCRT